MYIPKINEMADVHEMTNFMKRFSFATIVSVQNDTPVATHLPFVVTAKEDEIKLYAHFAKANPQWENIEKGNVLVIFSEPNAYISPTNYDQFLSPPTWDYIAVHIYGSVKIISEKKEVLSVLERIIDNYEKPYKKHWSELSQDYKDTMLKNAVVFEVNVLTLQGKEKLSQDRTKQEQGKIIHTLSKSTNGSEKLIAEYMRKLS